MSKRISLSETAHDAVRTHLHHGDLAVDATLGNGHDALFLTQCVGKTGHVYGFDIQAGALQATGLRLREHGMLNRATLLQVSHAELAEYVPGQVKAIMFNLGYMPGSDKKIMTRAESTLSALNAACQILESHGVMTVMAYPGHVGGEEEAGCVELWAGQLNPAQYRSQMICSEHHKASAPRLFVIRKLANLL
ncbi:tRNA (mnm(5)s(2)U34)-methyltransferase [Methylomonas sp. MgM2]